MKVLTIVFILAVAALVIGCGEKKVDIADDQGTDDVPDAAPEATEAETTEEFDQTYVEDEEIDIGELY